jgi:hypothetical protein
MMTTSTFAIRRSVSLLAVLATFQFLVEANPVGKFLMNFRRKARESEEPEEPEPSTAMDLKALVSSSDQFPLLVAVAVAVIVLTTQIKPLLRVITTFFSRLHLQWVIVPRKTDDNVAAAAEVTGLYIYPVKSLRTVPVDKVEIDAKGLFVGDRRFMIVTPAPLPALGSFGPDDATHRFLSQRQCPSLARVMAEFNKNNTTLTLSSDLLPQRTCIVMTQPAPDAPTYRSTLWGDIVTVIDMGDNAAEYLSQIVAKDAEVPDELKQGARLVMQSSTDSRTAGDQYVPASARSWTGQNPSVHLGDGFPM